MGFMDKNKEIAEQNEKEFLESDEYNKSLEKARHDLREAKKELAIAIGQTGLGKLFKKIYSKLFQHEQP